ncbi:MAG TPA: threonine/serine exporter family protein [Candidatus Xenobia bacterium]|jgi:uncharacterized membrane protein YjjP (DUF1212 family)
MLTTVPAIEPVPAESRLEEVARVLVLAGRELLRSGSEISRVEETLTRMGHACGIPSVDVLATPTGIHFSLVERGQTLTRVVSARLEGLNLSKVAMINGISRALEARRMDRFEALDALVALEGRSCEYPAVVLAMARGVSSGCWALLLGGTYSDFMPAVVVAFVVHAVYDWMARRAPEFLAIFFATFVGTAVSILGAHVLHVHESALIVGVTVPLVPGMALTGALRNLIRGDLLSGVAQGASALLTAGAIGAAVAAALSLARGFW